MSNIQEKECYPVHKWGGAIIVVDEQRMEVQYPQLVGAPCDCGRFVWHEEECGCIANRHWGAKPKENINH